MGSDSKNGVRHQRALSPRLSMMMMMMNAILGKVGRHTSEKIILQLVSSKCMPVLLYGLEACPLNKAALSSLDFVINRFFMKLFKSNNIDIVDVSLCRFQPSHCL